MTSSVNGGKDKIIHSSPAVTEFIHKWMCVHADMYIVCHIRFNVSSSIYTHVYRVYYYPLNNVNIHSRNSVWSVLSIDMTINRHAIYSIILSQGLFRVVSLHVYLSISFFSLG